jgi:hypothetical protein
MDPPPAQTMLTALESLYALSDHLTLLTVNSGRKVANFSDPWCYEIFMQTSMRRLQDVRKQLLGNIDLYFFLLLAIIMKAITI